MRQICQEDLQLANKRVSGNQFESIGWQTPDNSDLEYIQRPQLFRQYCSWISQMLHGQRNVDSRILVSQYATIRYVAVHTMAGGFARQSRRTVEWDIIWAQQCVQFSLGCYSGYFCHFCLIPNITGHLCKAWVSELASATHHVPDTTAVIMKNLQLTATLQSSNGCSSSDNICTYLFFTCTPNFYVIMDLLEARWSDSTLCAFFYFATADGKESACTVGNWVAKHRKKTLGSLRQSLANDFGVK